MSKISAAAMLEMPVAERLQLVEEIWNSIADEPGALEVTDGEKELIDQRLEAFHRTPDAGSSWETVRARIASRGT